MSNTTVISIDGVDYVRSDSLPEPAITDIGPYVIVRSGMAGVFAGSLVEHDRSTQTVVLANARRLWYWSGAASLSQLATDGVSKPNQCKFAMAVSAITIAGVIEVIPATKAARQSVESVAVWRV